MINSESQGESPSKHLIGSSGTLNLIGQSECCLEAGENMTLPIWIRGVGGGKQILKLILQYSSEDGKTVRYIRKTIEVHLTIVVVVVIYF